jgi:parvulin-like peptidyl-prolyl isomerase
MLKQLRNKKTAKKIWIGLAILIVPAFVLWGFGGAFRSKEESNFAGRIFGKKVSLLDYKDALEAAKNQAIMQFGENFTEVQKYLNLESQTWERLALLEEAKRRKIKVSDQEVITSIETYPFFKNKTGQFDNRIYSEMLQYVFRTQPRTFEEETRQNLMLEKLYKETTGGVTLDEKEVKEGYTKLNEEISIYFIASVPSDSAKDIILSEPEIKDYYAKNSLQFKQPISFNIEYLTVDSENKAKDTISRLRRKGDFAKIAKGLNATIKETGFFAQTDPIPGIGWSPQILSLLSKAKTGQVLPPIRTDKYYYILKVKEKRDTYIPDFESIKEKVKEAFIKDKSASVAKEKIENCLKELKEAYENNPRSADFAKAAKKFYLKSDSTELFKYGSYIEGIGASDNLWIAARGLKEDEFSGIIEMPSGFYIVKLKSKVPIDSKKFEAEKNDFSQGLLIEKKRECFVEFLSELKRKAGIFDASLP